MSDRSVMDEFRLGVERASGGRAIVSVAGEVDLHSAPELRARLSALASEGVTRVTVDLTEATFLDSMALGVLLGARKRLADASADLDLVVATPEIGRVFEITMLDRVFQIYPTRTAASAAGEAS